MVFCRRIASLVAHAIRILVDLLVVTITLPLLVIHCLWVKLLHLFIHRTNSRRILLGVQEVASNLHSIQKCLDGNGRFTTAIIRNNKYSGPSQFGLLGKNSRRHYINPGRFAHLDSVLLFPLRKAFYFIKYFCTHDILWLIWNETFLPWGVDLLISKLSGKRVILMHCGDDVRYRPMQRVIDREFQFSSWLHDAPNTRQFLSKLYYAKLSQSCGTVLSMRNQSTFQERASVMFRFPMPGCLTKPRKAGPIVRIVHAPSCRYTKATPIVLEAVDLLKRSGVSFAFHLLENQPNDLVLKTLGESDILIDQPGDWVGRLGIEACAASCCVIGGNKAEYNAQFDSPVIQFERNAEQLASTLEELINDRNSLEARMSGCFNFWREYYSEDAFIHFFQLLLTNEAKTFQPLKNQKQLLLSAASGRIERASIRLFYHPRTE